MNHCIFILDKHSRICPILCKKKKKKVQRKAEFTLAEAKHPWCRRYIITLKIYLPKGKKISYNFSLGNCRYCHETRVIYAVTKWLSSLPKVWGQRHSLEELNRFPPLRGARNASPEWDVQGQLIKAAFCSDPWKPSLITQPNGHTVDSG